MPRNRYLVYSRLCFGDRPVSYTDILYLLRDLPSSRPPSSPHRDHRPTPAHHLHHICIHQRAFVLPSAPDRVPYPREDQNPSRDNNTVVHRASRHGRLRRPDRPEDDEHHIDACVCVVDRPQQPGDVPRPPDQLDLRDSHFRRAGRHHFLRLVRSGAFGRGGEVLGIGPVGHDVAFDAVVEQQARGEEVRAVEAGDGQGDDVVEGGVAPDVDERQEAGEAADGQHRDDGDLVVGRDLAEESRGGGPAVAGERPGHPRGGGDDSRGACPGQGEDDGPHGDGAALGLYGVVEDLDEGVAGGRFEHGGNVPEAEEGGDHHREADATVDQHARADGAGDAEGGVLDFFRHVDAGVGADEGGDVAQESNAIGKALRGPAPLV